MKWRDEHENQSRDVSHDWVVRGLDDTWNLWNDQWPSPIPVNDRGHLPSREAAKSLAEKLNAILTTSPPEPRPVEVCPECGTPDDNDGFNSCRNRKARHAVSSPPIQGEGACPHVDLHGDSWKGQTIWGKPFAHCPDCGQPLAIPQGGAA